MNIKVSLKFHGSTIVGQGTWHRKNLIGWAILTLNVEEVKSELLTHKMHEGASSYIFISQYFCQGAVVFTGVIQV